MQAITQLDNGIWCHVAIAEKEYAQNTAAPSHITYARPRDVALILTQWGAPEPLILAGLWSSALRGEEKSVYIAHLESDVGVLAYQAAQYITTLGHSRLERRTVDNLAELFGDYLSAELLILISALFLAAFRRAMQDPSSYDREMLAVQAKGIIEPIVSERLGLWTVHRELDDLALQCLKPEQYYRIIDYTSTFHGLELMSQQISALVRRKAQQIGVHFVEIEPHTVHPAKVEKVRGQRGLNDISPNELVSFTVIVDEVLDCYTFLYVLHSLGEPTEIRDFITHPKRNGYQSLHTTVIIPDVGAIMFLVRTKKMQTQAYAGILEGIRYRKITLRDLFIAPPKGHILVLTSNGQRYILPENATALDLAYEIDVPLGHAFRNVRIFSSDLGEAGPDYVLSDGEIVEIISDSEGTPRETWLEYVTTEKARTAITAYLRAAHGLDITEQYDIKFWPARHSIQHRDKMITLTRTEWQMFEVLYKGIREIVTYRTCIDALWGIDTPDNDAVRKRMGVHMSRLRKKVRSLGGVMDIDNKSGEGYQLVIGL